jgi:hypothetical protein
MPTQKLIGILEFLFDFDQENYTIFIYTYLPTHLPTYPPTHLPTVKSKVGLRQTNIFLRPT